MRYPRLYQKLYCEPLMLSMDAFTAFDRVFQSALSGPAVRQVDRATTDAPSGEYLDMYRRSRATMEQIRVEEVLRKYGPVAVIQVHGAIDRNLSRMEVECYGACDLQDINAAAADCDADGALETVIFDFDTPGGGVIGLAETAALIVRLGLTKNTVAWVGGQCCSAGVYLAVHCHQIVIAEGAMMGSVGVRCARLDMTAAMEKQGVLVTLIASSEEKTDFSPAKAMTPAERARIQTRVDMLAEDFKSRVRAGRPGISDDVLHAQIYFGQEAVAVGFADAVLPSLDDLAMELMAASSVTAANPGGGGMEYDAGKAPRAEGEGTFGAQADSPFRAEGGNGGGNPNHDPGNGQFTHSDTFDIKATGADAAAVRHGLLQTDKAHGVNNHLVNQRTKVYADASEIDPSDLGRYKFDGRDGKNGVYVQPGHPQIVLTTVHESGHRIDHMAFGSQGYKKVASESGAIDDLMTVIRSGKASRRLAQAVKDVRGSNLSHAKDVRYLNTPEERFARAYTHYVVQKSGDPELKRQFDEERNSNRGQRLMYHSDEEFGKVEQAFDKHFAKIGLRKKQSS